MPDDIIAQAIAAAKHAEAIMRRTAAGENIALTPDEPHGDWQPKYKNDGRPTIQKWHPPYGETHVKYHVYALGGGKNPVIWGSNHHGTYQGMQTVDAPFGDHPTITYPSYEHSEDPEHLGRFKTYDQAKAAAEEHYRQNYGTPPKHDYDIDSIMNDPISLQQHSQGLGDDEDYSRIFDAVRRALKKAGALLRRTAAEGEPFQMSDELKSLLADHVRKQFQKKPKVPEPGKYDWGVDEDDEGPWLFSTPTGGGGSHYLSVFPPTDDDPRFSWHHSSGGKVVDRGFAPSQEQAQRNAEASHKATSWSPDEKQDPFDPRLIGAGIHARLAAQVWRRHAKSYMEEHGFTCQHCGGQMDGERGNYYHAEPSRDEDHDPQPGYYDFENNRRSPYQERTDILDDPDFKSWAKTLDKKTRDQFGRMTRDDLMDSWQRSTGQKSTTHDFPESHIFADSDGNQWKAVNSETGEDLHPGDTIQSGNGESYLYHGIDTFPGQGGRNPASSGRISVHSPDFKIGPRHLNAPRAFYPSVFNAEIVPHTGGWNPDDAQDPFDPRIIGAGLHRRLTASTSPVDPGVMGRIAAELSPPCPDCGQVAGFDEHMVSPSVKVCRNCDYPMLDYGVQNLLDRTLSGHDRAIAELPETDHPTLGKHGQLDYDDAMKLIDEQLAAGEPGREHHDQLPIQDASQYEGVPVPDPITHQRGTCKNCGTELIQNPFTKQWLGEFHYENGCSAGPHQPTH